ncbi:MAG TPA: rhomboid family intramembrane serine protease [Anaerolineae bacterium]|nr:rhomboid family intramembrane serine protease [Anaerolineae bacterium]
MNELAPLLVIYFFLNMILFLPLRDSRTRGQRLPIITLALIGVNVGVYVVQAVVWPMQLGDAGTNNVVYGLMLIPARVMSGATNGAVTMITSAFLHGGWLHLAGNMFFLLFFGRKVEDGLGRTKFLLLYFVCIFTSGIGSVVGEVALPVWKGVIPNLGASGAIMGVVGAYLFLFSEEKIHTVVLLGGLLPVPFFPRVTAGFFIGYQIVGDVVNGLLIEQFQKLGRNFSSVNSFAHLSGLVGGLIAIYLFLPREMLHYRYKPTTRPRRSD